MDYITVKEASEKWGVTPRRVNYYCAGGRISGAVKMAGVWLIPNKREEICGNCQWNELCYFHDEQ